ncbi:MAG: hypothetical protein B1H08_06030 [Candidatus Omnitrophica bacterium 4484_171]|nr:MAG: hypothetical protein B1H08_06030 [Candidatus Omnitrophica bacterium 4484_171]
MLAKKVLIADDERDFVTFLSVALKREGFDVFTAFDGIEAKERIEEDSPDIVILDLIMPHLNGWEVLKWIKEKERRIPVIILSAKDDFDDIKNTYNLNADYYMTKPVSVRDIVKGINTVSAPGTFRSL